MKKTLTLLFVIFHFFAIAQADSQDTLSMPQDTEADFPAEEDPQEYVEPSPPMPKFEEKALNSKKWNELTKGLQYDGYDKAEKKLETKTLPYLNFLSALGPLFKYFFIIFILCLILFFVVRWVLRYKRKPGNALEKLIYEIDAQGMQLPLTTLDQLIDAAVANQQLSEALKLYYLKSLRILDLKNHITWERHKTNNSYIRECRQKDFLPAFRNLTRLYERYWYGDQDLQPASFEGIRDLFTAFYQKIQ